MKAIPLYERPVGAILSDIPRFDRHVKTRATRNKAALTFSCRRHAVRHVPQQLNHEVRQPAAHCEHRARAKRDRRHHLLGRIPELMIAAGMHACVCRWMLVVYGGFDWKALPGKSSEERLESADSRDGPEVARQSQSNSKSIATAAVERSRRYSRRVCVKRIGHVMWRWFLIAIHCSIIDLMALADCRTRSTRRQK